MKYLVKPIYKPFLYCIDFMGSFLFRNKKKEVFEKEKIKRIAIIRFDHLGDVILTTPLFRILRMKFPHAKITLLCRTIAKEIMQENKNLDEVISLEPPWFDRNKEQNKQGFNNFIEEHKKYYDLVLELHADPRNIFFADKIGKYTIGYGIRGFGFLLNKTAEYSLEKKHIIERNSDVLSAIGTYEKDKKDMKTEITIPQKVENDMRKDLPKGFLICINPGTGRSTKMWDTLKWAKVADELIKKYNVTIVFTGSQKEKGIIQEITEDMHAKKYVDMSGKTSPLTLAAVIKQCSLFISPDTGPLHIARAVETPSIGLFGPVDPAVWGYNEKNHHSIFKNIIENEYVETNKGMQAITVKDVLLEVDRIISFKKAKKSKI